ncbi:MAG: sulfatase-like hydrolase/transferase [Gaiellaceae bacterium]
MRIRGLVLLALAAGVLLAPAPAAHAARPNVVIVLTDDQRWDTLSAMPTVRSEIVAKGVTFSNSFTVNPLCCPSRASFLTGLYSHSTRVYHNRGARGLRSFDERSSLAIPLRATGYRTGLIGKYMNDYTTTRVPRGWDRWVVFTGSIDKGRPPGFFNYDLSVDGTLVSRGSAPTDYSTDVLAAQAQNFIRGSAGRPFFLLFAPFAPHHPATPAPRHAGAFPGLSPWRPPSYNEANVSDKPAWLRRRARIDAQETARLDAFRRDQLRSLLAVDDAVASILSTLEDEGRLANTLILYTSDNGHFWGEHRLNTKMAAYEESIRVPLVARYDPLTTTPRTESRFVANIDVAPTIARFAGIRRRFHGQSFRPLLAGASTVWRKTFLIENLRLNAGNVATYCAVRGGRWTYVALRTGEEELYDLATDPDQLTNRARNPALRPQLMTMRARVRDLCDPPPPSMNLDWLCTKNGSTTAETLRGTGRSDGLCAGGGRDTLWGLAGNDLLRGGPGRDRMLGGPGRDRILDREGARDTIACGSGVDRVLADRLDVVAKDCEIVRR